MKDIKKIVEESLDVINDIKSFQNDIEKIIEIIVNSLKNNGKVIIFGNGGSAADSQHFAAELVGRFIMERQGLPAISLTTDTSIITSIGNDYSFERIFERQCESLVNSGDVVIGISTSGNSQNVLLGLRKAKELSAKTIGLLGNNGGKIKDNVDLSIIVKSDKTARIQEAQRVILHIICENIEEKIFSNRD